MYHSTALGFTFSRFGLFLFFFEWMNEWLNNANRIGEVLWDDSPFYVHPRLRVKHPDGAFNNRLIFFCFPSIFIFCSYWTAVLKQLQFHYETFRSCTVMCCGVSTGALRDATIRNKAQRRSSSSSHHPSVVRVRQCRGGGTHRWCQQLKVPRSWNRSAYIEPN